MTQLPGLVRIGLLEHSDYITAENFLSRAFPRIGYDVQITRLQMEHVKNLDSAKNVLASEGFDVFASDISLGATENYAGLDVIRKVKTQWPDLYVIGISRSHVSYRDVSNKMPTFDVFVYKPMINDPAYFSHIVQTIQEGFRRNIFVQIDPNSILDDELKTSTMFKEIESIVKQITFTLHSADRATVVSRVHLKPLEGGFSISKVYRLLAFSSSDLECVHAVLKLSKPNAARNEYENYMNYVEWYLPYTWRPELLGRAFTRRWGAVCYAFAYSENSQFTSLNAVIEAKKNSQIMEIAQKIFDPDRQRWYHSSNILEEAHLTEYYFNRWFPARNIDLESRFRSIISSYDLSNHEVVRIHGNEYKMPEGFLLGKPRGKYQSCIRHGDLHGSNILVTATNDIHFIDFQDTGRGHVFEDFVVFESSIRVQYEAGMDLIELMMCESAELSDNESALPFRDILQTIRERAKQNFPHEIWSNYIYALALFSYRLLRINELKKWQKEQLAACLLACIGWLDLYEHW